MFKSQVEAEKIQARNIPVSTLQNIWVPNKGVIWVIQRIPAGHHNSNGQHRGLYNPTCKQAEAYLFLSPFSQSLFFFFGGFAFRPLSPSLSFSFLFLFKKIFLEALFCQSLSAATQAWVKQQQMHNEMYRLENELRRVRGREYFSHKSKQIIHYLLIQPKTNSNLIKNHSSGAQTAENRIECFTTQN